MAFVVKTGIKCGPSLKDCQDQRQACLAAARNVQAADACGAAFTECLRTVPRGGPPAANPPQGKWARIKANVRSLLPRKA